MQRLLADVYGEGLGQVGVTDLLMVFVLKGDVLPGVGPTDVPAGSLHGRDEGILGYGFFPGFHYSLETFHQVGRFLFVDHGPVFLLVPGDAFTFFHPAAVEMFSFFGYGQAPIPAHLVHSFLHVRQVLGSGVEFVTVLIADRVGHHMKVEMAPVLVDSHQDLVAGKCFFSEFLAKGQHLFRCDFFILMEGNNIVSAHPSGVLVPDFFFFPKGATHGIPGQRFRSRAGHIHVAVFHFVLAQDVFDGVPEPAMGLWWPRYCLKHRHGMSISFRQFWMASMQLFSSERVGIRPASERNCCWLIVWVSIIRFNLFRAFVIWFRFEQAPRSC